MTLRNVLFTSLFIALWPGLAYSVQDTGESPEVTMKRDLSALEGTHWTVVGIEGKAPLADAAPDLTFGDNARIAGTTGCNRYFGTAKLQGDALSFKGVGATLMACNEDRMQQERKFLDTLQVVTALSRPDANQLVLSDSDGAERIVLALSSEPGEVGANDQPQDLPVYDAVTFACQELGSIDFRFLGPETIELKTADERHILALDKSDSDAHYSGDDIKFWNRGDTAVLQVGASRYECRRRNTN